MLEIHEQVRKKPHTFQSLQPMALLGASGSPLVRGAGGPVLPIPEILLGCDDSVILESSVKQQRGRETRVGGHVRAGDTSWPSIRPLAGFSSYPLRKVPVP